MVDEYSSTAAPVPIARPATVQKNTDGTHSVRIQHYETGVVSEVHFPNVYFAETLAHGYATFLNGFYKLEGSTKEAVASVEPDAQQVLASARKEGAEVLEAAKEEAERLLAVAKEEVVKIKSDAEHYYSLSVSTLAGAKDEAAKVLADAKTEADKLLIAAKAAIAEYRKPKQSKEATVHTIGPNPKFDE